MNAVAVVVVAVTVVVFAYVRSYNRLVNGRELLDDAWASVAAVLDRRHELVPQLAEAVTASPVGDQPLVDDLLRTLRVAAEAGPDAEARREPERDLALAAAAVIDLRRPYPVLDTERGFNDVRRELAVNDDRLRDAAYAHDERAADLDRRMGSFPSNLVAKRHGFTTPSTFAM
ncbi:MAG: LemA family protein [Ilumatobacteraceae bacterium]